MEKKTKVAVLLTCYNRREKTIACIKSLYEGNPELDFRFIVTDDNSTDNTKEALLALPCKVKVIEGSGRLFWNRGMYSSISFATNHTVHYDYALLVNDDVVFYEHAIEEMLARIVKLKADVIVGATCGSDGKMSYGGVVKASKLFAKFALLEPDGRSQCDTFNCNCVLMDSYLLQTVGNVDPTYIHSMGDYDFGLKIRKLGYTVITSKGFVGECDDNPDEGTWRDTTLPRRERLRLKESAKGLPRKDWFYFVKKNYGMIPAMYHSITPYIRILLGR